MAKRGLIVGKFYPPHRGHQYLIETACAQVEELNVIVCQRPHEQPVGALRAAWLRELYPTINVLLIDDVYDEQDSRVWAENCLRWLGGRPELVFTSESYGEAFARFLGCTHISVDQARTHVPISGTQVRAHPLQYWDFLAPPVRGYYAKRVCLVGAESTGKTTLAQALAERFATVWVAEYGREYAERKLAETGQYTWQADEFLHIAATQSAREAEAARRANKVLICDTDAFATSIWQRRYLGECTPAVTKFVAQQRRPDVYLLTDVNTPFVQDGTRDGEASREWRHETFIAELRGQARPFQLLTGTFHARLEQASTLIEELLNH